jgi:hypothetical protein
MILYKAARLPNFAAPVLPDAFLKGYAPRVSGFSCSVENLFFLYEAPLLRHQSPSGDGAHWNTTIQISRNNAISRTGNTSISPDGDATAAGACLQDQKERQSF